MTLRDEFEKQAVKEGLDVTRSISSKGLSYYHKAETAYYWLQWIENHLESIQKSKRVKADAMYNQKKHCAHNKEGFGVEWSNPRLHPALDRDYVNTKKPSALKVFWNRHGDSVRFWVIVALIILTSSVYAG